MVEHNPWNNILYLYRFLFDCFDGTSGWRVSIHLGFSRSSEKHTWLYSVAIHLSLEKNRWRRDDPNIVQQVEDVEIPPLVLGDEVFPLRTFMMKPHGDAILPDDNPYFNYRHSWARLVTEGAFGILKIRARVIFRKCESNKETFKLYSLVCVVLHNLCIERCHLVPRKFDLTLSHASNKRLNPEEVRNILTLRRTNQSKQSKQLNKKFEKH